MSKQREDLVLANQDISEDESYQELLSDLRGILSDGLKRAYEAVEETRETQKALTTIKKALRNFAGALHFVDRQVPLKIGQKTHFVDLVLYHEKLNCPVLVRLKDGKFESGDVGLMNTWVNFYRKNLQNKH